MTAQSVALTPRPATPRGRPPPRHTPQIQDTLLKAKAKSHTAEYDSGVGRYCPGLVPCAVACRWDLVCEFCEVHDPMARQRSHSFESLEDGDSDGSGGSGEALEEEGGRRRRGSFVPPSLREAPYASASAVGARTAPAPGQGLLDRGGSMSHRHLHAGGGTFGGTSVPSRPLDRRFSSGEAGVRMKDLTPARDRRQLDARQ